MADILAPILQSYTNFTLVNDREKEINSLKYISFENNYPDVSAGSRLVIVLIETRLIEAGGNTSLQHSGSAHSAFAPITNATTYQNECGGAPFRWTYDSAGRSHKPSFAGIGGTADNRTHRTLWHYDALKDGGASIIIHAGCETNYLSSV
jgi:hypothetical protein